MDGHGGIQLEDDEFEEGNIEALDEEGDISNDELDPPKRSEETTKGTRGRTKLEKVIKNRSKGKRETIEYDEH